MGYLAASLAQKQLVLVAASFGLMVKDSEYRNGCRILIYNYYHVQQEMNVTDDSNYVITER
ncbi:hypothetical protein D3C78_643350 [compost metagenome]